MSEFDVVVVGAGPAGSATAISCASQGVRVALLEQSLFPRERPGETLPPGVEPLLQQLGVVDPVLAAGFIRHRGHWVQWGKERQLSAFGGTQAEPWHGFQIPRSVLDTLLVKRAAELGVVLVQPCRAEKIIVREGRVAGIQTDRGPFFCQTLVDATGTYTWLSRQLSLEWQEFSPRLIARYGYVTGNIADLDDVPSLLAEPYGWSWTAKISQTVCHWTRMYFDAEHASQTAPPTALMHLAALGSTRGAVVTWRRCKSMAGDGFFIVGDAASVMDPGAAHGVLKALMTGMMAAHAITQRLSNPLHEQAIRTQYQQWIDQWFMRDIQAMREFYRAHPTPPHWLM